jgi:hypothetical protein
MKRVLFVAAALAVQSIGANARDDRLPAKFVGDWCFAEHAADHLAFYRRGRCANPDNVDDWLTISPELRRTRDALSVARCSREQTRRLSRQVPVRRQSDSELLVLAVQRSALRIADRHRAVIIPPNAA